MKSDFIGIKLGTAYMLSCFPKTLAVSLFFLSGLAKYLKTDCFFCI